MKHATLYRRWRPRAFSQIVGQEPVVRTLKRAIETGRVAHAYLFSGPRGTGKTSTAKVLAMGLNCVHGPTPEPCGECESCRAIVNNSSLDVVEMDAASNRGIDEIRDLRDRVNLAPVSGRMKVYIIDEVHMLTTEAFNALLKMLEEPPEHVVFVLATTEKHKVLPTIVSRCQSFDFRRPGVETLANKLAGIAEAEGIDAEPEALTVIARAGGGSFRDAEGLLDQLSSFAEGGITASMVRELLGSAGPQMLLETADALHERRSADALRLIDRLSNEGRDPGQFASELISHLRTLMLLPHAPEVALAEVGTEERAPLEEQAGRIPTAEVVRMIEALGGSLGRIKRGGDPKLELELCFLRLTRDYTEPSVESLVARLEALEKMLERGEAPARHGPRTATDESPEPASPKPESGRDAGETGAENASAQDGPAQGESAAEEEGDEQVPDLAGNWGALLRDLRGRRQAPAAAVYEEARIEGFDGRTLLLSFPEELGIYAKLARDARHADPLLDAIEDRFGVRPRLEARAGGGAHSPSRPVEWSSREASPSRPVTESPPSQEPPAEEPSAEGLREETREAANGAGALPPRAAGDDGTIRSEAEVFEAMRQRSGLRDGGS